MIKRGCTIYICIFGMWSLGRFQLLTCFTACRQDYAINQQKFREVGKLGRKSKTFTQICIAPTLNSCKSDIWSIKYMMINRGPQKNMENMATMLLITISKILVLNWRYACEILAILLISLTFTCFTWSATWCLRLFTLSPCINFRSLLGCVDMI